MSSEPLICWGLTRESAPLHLRERVSAAVEPSADVYRELHRFSCERLLLSTCERFEIYTYSSATPRGELPRWLAAACGIGADELARHALVLQGPPVVEHLFRVASGMEALVTGESQILSQLRNAFLVADRYGGTGPILHCLARSAIHTGRRVRRETGINRPNRSVATIAIECLSRRFTSLADKYILVIGTGLLASDICRQLTAHRLRRLVIASHRESRAASFAKPFSGVGVALSGLDEAINHCDAVIACTNAGKPVVELSHVGRRLDREVTMLDLGMPRNVDPAVARLSGVRLEHLDDMLDQKHARLEFPDADRIVREELARFTRWFRSRRVAPSIARLVDLRYDPHRSTPSRSRRALHREIMRIKAEVAA